MGCADSPTGATPAAPDGLMRSEPAFAMSCQQGIFTGFDATNGWACNATVDFYPEVPELANDLGTAVSAWRNRLSATGLSDLPTFKTTTDPSQAEATVTGTGTGTNFCGTWNNSTKVLTVYADAGCNNFDNKGPLLSLLRHEVGHAVGWTGSSVDKIIFATSAAQHCVMNLPSDGSLNPTICAHEIEGALAAYGLVSYDYENFFTTPFVVGANALTPLYLQTGQVDTLVPGEWRLETGGTVAGTGGAYTWTSTSDAVATVSGGVVTAVGPGTATIRAVPQSSSSYHHAHPFRTAGVSTTVTVTSPPPEFIVTTDEMPIVTPGTHTFTAHIGWSGSMIFWKVDDSRTLGVDPDTTFVTVGQTVQLPVGTGSYTLTFKVALEPSPLIWQEQHITVCTDGNPALLAGSTWDDGNETDAVANCPPPEQE